MVIVHEDQTAHMCVQWNNSIIGVNNSWLVSTWDHDPSAVPVLTGCDHGHMGSIWINLDKHFRVDKLVSQRPPVLQWNLSVTTTSITKFITCDLFSKVL